MSKRLTDAESELLFRNIASMVGSGVKHSEIRARLTLTHHELRKYLEHPHTQRYIAELAEETSKSALATLRKGIEGMAELTLEALKGQLKKGNILAVRTALEVMGALDKDKPVQGDQSITVILPGAERPADIVIPATDPGEAPQ